MIDKEQIFEQIRLVAYNYAKRYYDNWQESFMCDLEEDSPYKHSLDDSGHPKEDIFFEQMGEQAWQCCICDSCNNKEFFEKFHIEVPSFIAEQIDEVDEGTLVFDIFFEGIEKFVNETYHNA